MSPSPPRDSGQHFDNGHSFNVLKHRPHKTLKHGLHALAATALVRIWHILFFVGAWSAMVCVVNVKTKVNFTVPNTMITVLGVLLGLTLSYRTSSAYEKYSDGRKQWANITLASRNWARTVWLHCPDHTVPDPAKLSPEDAARDEARAVLEKKTTVQLALAFAVAVKHYLRHEPGIYYKDLYHLVAFVPSLNLPSGLAGGAATMAGNLPSISAHDHALLEAEQPRKLRETVKDNMLPDFMRRRRRSSAAHSGAGLARILGAHGEGQNVPLEITVFMGMYIATLQRRKTIDAPTTTALMNALAMLADSLANLERILTTPIPWSYDAHIWAITTYIVMGYASIAEEIENPFGYDKNDLNLGYFCREIIARELDAVTSRPYIDPEDWIFSPANRPFGRDHPNAPELVKDGNIDELRRQLSHAGAGHIPTCLAPQGSGTSSPFMV
ncbi:hypothetical protein Q8F55_006043 [Vanrija albida]|uniref:Uncharacterized protein n=1 Tax=Vanrija albida TaxID=181172 RepID=A0ABR3Q392_9TREE